MDVNRGMQKLEFKVTYSYHYTFSWGEVGPGFDVVAGDKESGVELFITECVYDWIMVYTLHYDPEIP